MCKKKFFPQVVSAKAFRFAIFSVLFVSSMLLLINRLQFDIAKPIDDEAHTIRLAVESLYTGEVNTLRVGETTRWLARLAYPYAIYYMNSNMGGEHYLTGWDYAGGFYLKGHLQDITTPSFDPNIEDFVYAMRFELGVLVILSFILASYYIALRYGLLSGLSYFVFSLTAGLSVDMLSIFYTESALVIIFNLLIIISLNVRVNKWRLYLWLALLLSAAVSTKLTGIYFLIPVLAILYKKDRDIFSGLKIELFFALSFVAYLSLNIFSTSYISLLDQTLSNVYHLKTGHLETYPSGFYQLKIILDKLSPWCYLFALAFCLLIISKSKKYTLFSFCASVCAILIVSAQINVSFALTRNLTIALVMMVYVISTTMLYKFNFFLAKKINDKKYKSFYILSVFSLLTFYLYQGSRLYHDISPSLLKDALVNCESIASIDVELDFVNGHTSLPSMPDAFNLTNQKDVFRHDLAPFDCVAIKRIKNNKHYTNYLLPIDFKLASRFGDYFVYKNNSFKTAQ